MSTKHTVFGAGQVGTQLAALLASEGHEVRLVRRSAPGSALAGVSWMRGDISDRAFADEACRGADVVYNCTNPPDYGDWSGLLPLYRAALQAAARADARFVQLDNLYMYGRPATAPFDERTPLQPCSDKGRLRKAWVEEMFAAHARGDVRVSSGRASDYFGPDTPNAAVLRPDVYERILKGGTVYVSGDPDTPHSYSYTPDVARGLAILGAHEAALGRAWHLPAAAQLSSRELIERFAAHVDTKVTVRRVPHWALRTVGVFSSLAGSIADMSYQWDIPYLIDDGDFRRTFGVGPTDLDEAIETTLAHHRAARAAVQTTPATLRVRGAT